MTKRQLKTALGLMRAAEGRIRPDAAWVARTRNQLLKEWRRDASVRPAPSLRIRAQALVSSFVPRPVIDFARGPVMAVLSVFGIMIGGSLASVSAAERSVPGDLLYPVKLASEQAQIMMQAPPDQLKLKAAFVERRGQEIKQLAQTNSPQPKKTKQIQIAADQLRQDLDAVKLQLHDVTSIGSASQAVAVAQDVDQKSGRLLQTLNEVKDSIPQDAQKNIAEAQVAAVNTGVKAIQVLINKRNDPGVQELVSDEDLKRVVTEHVRGLEDGINDTTKKVDEAKTASQVAIAAASTTIGTLPTATSTEAITAANATVALLVDPLDQLKAARATLQETKQLLQTDQMSAVGDKLGEAANAISSAQRAVTSALQPVLAEASSSTIPQEASTSTVVTATTTAEITASTKENIPREATTSSVPDVTSSTPKTSNEKPEAAK